MLVTFFGLKHKSFNEIVYVSQVEIIEEKASYLENGSKYLVLTDKVDGSGADATVSTTIQNVTVKGGSYNGTALTAENLGTYTFGHASNYGGKLYTKGGSYATTGITYAE